MESNLFQPKVVRP